MEIHNESILVKVHSVHVLQTSNLHSCNFIYCDDHCKKKVVSLLTHMKEVGILTVFSHMHTVDLS
jgi:hypothetical protein